MGGRVKPFLYILPAYLAIVVYLVYPTILTFINSFKDRAPRSGSASRTTPTCSPTQASSDTMFNTLLGCSSSLRRDVVLGLAVATLADRLGPRGEKLSKTIIFLPMAISMVGAATIWRFVYVRGARRASRRSAC